MVVSITKVNNTGCIDSSIKSKKIHFLDDSGEGAGSEDASEPHKEDDESLPGFLARSLSSFHEKSHLTYRTIPNVSLQDIKLKEKLGEGGFAIVYAAEYNGHSCAFKSLQSDVVSGAANTLKIAAADLCKEAELLSALNHPNIVSILAKGTDVSNVKNNFIVIERLEDTLEHRMKVWREHDQKIKSNLKERLRLLHDRLRVCLDVCHALQYMHEMNVLYRDLKAENLGFDRNDNIKLFGK
jgi:serine/threonine protein kinase